MKRTRHAAEGREIPAPPVAPIPAVLDTRGLAALLRVNVRTVRSWLHGDDTAPKKRWVGNGWRFLGPDVADWLASRPSRHAGLRARASSGDTPLEGPARG